MQALGLNQIRELFLSFFEARGHLRLPSFSLVPQNDPSVLLINAGMTPLKAYFAGTQTPPAPRVTTCQKCIRTPDIERVGRTARHGTFFEMLGNFSFGDYFKKEVIPWAWEFCTQVLEMPPERLHASVYFEDDEAYAIWRDEVGLPESHLHRLGKEDNFWEHGTGPCGPCSEIYFDRGPERGCGLPTCAVGCDCDRFVEFWNLVFTQFDRQADGTYVPLARKNIDTGAGLERLAALMQDVGSLFEVDTIRAVLDTVCHLTKTRYGENEKTDMAIRVIVDHTRSVAMMLADGILPANEGRGYVLRRLLRRAARFGRLLGVQRPFLHELVPVIVQLSGEAYPELRFHQERITAQIQREESRFLETITQGSQILDEIIQKIRQSGGTSISGADAFRLHDTYGFPLGLTEEIAAEQGLSVDEAGFRLEMDRQREQARQALRDKVDSAWGEAAEDAVFASLPATRFIGYDTLSGTAQVVALKVSESNEDAHAEGDSEQEASPQPGQPFVFAVTETPFYAASGGQAGDIGIAVTPNGRLTVLDVTHTPGQVFLHRAVLDEGTLHVGDTLHLQVDRANRLDTARNHTATHLLQQALREVVGEHAAQAGSAVSADRLRFDFTHHQPLTPEQKRQVEDRVNEVVLRNEPVQTRVMSLAEAKASGAVALFGEKYGEKVRVVSVGNFSRELCGGTHLERSAEVGQFRIQSEGGVAAGVRRIEAITGPAAWQQAREQDQLIHSLAAALKTAPQDLQGRVLAQSERLRRLEKEMELLQSRQTAALSDQLREQAETIAGVTVLIARVAVPDAGELRTVADRMRDALGAGQGLGCLIALAAAAEGKALWVVTADAPAVARGLAAGHLIRIAAKVTGGGGGGRPDMAQAGGKDPSRIDEALAELNREVKAILQTAS